MAPVQPGARRFASIGESSTWNRVGPDPRVSGQARHAGKSAQRRLNDERASRSIMNATSGPLLRLICFATIAPAFGIADRLERKDDAVPRAGALAFVSPALYR